MKIKLDNFSLVVTREAGDKKYFGIRNAKGESNFLYAFKNELNKRGFNLVKIRMGKDGHLVDDIQQYLRPKHNKPTIPQIYLWNSYWALQGLEEDWNKGEVRVKMEYDICDNQPNCKEMVEKLLK